MEPASAYGSTISRLLVDGAVVREVPDLIPLGLVQVGMTLMYTPVPPTLLSAEKSILSPRLANRT